VVDCDVFTFCGDLLSSISNLLHYVFAFKSVDNNVTFNISVRIETITVRGLPHLGPGLFLVWVRGIEIDQPGRFEGDGAGCKFRACFTQETKQLAYISNKMFDYFWNYECG